MPGSVQVVPMPLSPEDPVLQVLLYEKACILGFGDHVPELQS